MTTLGLILHYRRANCAEGTVVVFFVIFPSFVNEGLQCEQ